MKKLILVLLALALATVSCSALASELVVEPGSSSGCSFQTFKLFLDLMFSSSGYEFTWSETPEKENAYDVYTGESSDGMFTLKVYASGEEFSHMVGEGTVTFIGSNVSDVQKLGEWGGAGLSSAAVSMYLLLDGELTDDVATRLQEELQPLLNEMTVALGDSKTASEGYAGTVTILGFPAGIEVRATGSSTLTVTMKTAITGQDGTISVK